MKVGCLLSLSHHTAPHRISFLIRRSLSLPKQPFSHHITPSKPNPNHAKSTTHFFHPLARTPLSHAALTTPSHARSHNTITRSSHNTITRSSHNTITRSSLTFHSSLCVITQPTQGMVRDPSKPLIGPGLPGHTATNGKPSVVPQFREIRKNFIIGVCALHVCLTCACVYVCVWGGVTRWRCAGEMMRHIWALQVTAVCRERVSHRCCGRCG
jgi:hypothetical protein